MRLRSDFWVQAYMRRVEGEGAFVALRRRGAEQAGAIYIKIDRLDGTAMLFGPAPQTAYDDDAAARRFAPLHDVPAIDAPDAEARLKREIGFDPDIWIVEVEDRQGRHFLDLAL